MLVVIAAALIAVLVVQTVVMRRRVLGRGAHRRALPPRPPLQHCGSRRLAQGRAPRWARSQYCPVGRHWSLVVPVKDADLTPAERAQAAERRDASIP